MSPTGLLTGLNVCDKYKGLNKWPLVLLLYLSGLTRHFGFAGGAPGAIRAPCLVRARGLVGTGQLPEHGPASLPASASMMDYSCPGVIRALVTQNTGETPLALGIQKLFFFFFCHSFCPGSSPRFVEKSQRVKCRWNNCYLVSTKRKAH